MVHKSLTRGGVRDFSPNGKAPVTLRAGWTRFHTDSSSYDSVTTLHSTGATFLNWLLEPSTFSQHLFPFGYNHNWLHFIHRHNYRLQFQQTVTSMYMAVGSYHTWYGYSRPLLTVRTELTWIWVISLFPKNVAWEGFKEMSLNKRKAHYGRALKSSTVLGTSRRQVMTVDVLVECIHACWVTHKPHST